MTTQVKKSQIVRLLNRKFRNVSTRETLQTSPTSKVAMAEEDVWRCILLVPVIEISQIEYLNGNAEILFRYPLP